MAMEEVYQKLLRGNADNKHPKGSYDQWLKRTRRIIDKIYCQWNIDWSGALETSSSDDESEDLSEDDNLHYYLSDSDSVHHRSSDDNNYSSDNDNSHYFSSDESEKEMEDTDVASNYYEVSSRYVARYKIGEQTNSPNNNTVKELQKCLEMVLVKGEQNPWWVSAKHKLTLNKKVLSKTRFVKANPVATNVLYKVVMAHMAKLASCKTTTSPVTWIQEIARCLQLLLTTTASYRWWMRATHKLNMESTKFMGKSRTSQEEKNTKKRLLPQTHKMPFWKKKKHSIRKCKHYILFVHNKRTKKAQQSKQRRTVELATPELALDKWRQSLVERKNTTTTMSPQETPACKADIVSKTMNINQRKSEPIKTFSKSLVHIKTRARLIKIGMLTTSLYSEGEKDKEKNLVSKCEETSEIW